MIQQINLSEMYLRDSDLRKKRKESYQKQIEDTNKLIKMSVKKISYSDMKEAYDYVDNLFPDTGVKEAEIYKVCFSDMKRMGYDGVEGYYDTICKKIILSGGRPETSYRNKYYIGSRITRDEVLVHEMLHYCYVAMGHRSISVEMIEEFAYGWYIGYLRKKGYSDEYIIKYNFLPFLMGRTKEKAVRKILAKNNISIKEYNSYFKYKHRIDSFSKRFSYKIFEVNKEIATEYGQKIVKMYSDKLDKKNGIIKEYYEEEEVSRFNFLDL